MRIRDIVIFLFFFAGFSCAESNNFLIRFLDKLDSLELERLDTNYVRPYREWWRVAYINSFSNTNMNIRSYSPLYGIEGNINADTKLKLALHASFRGLGVTYAHDVDSRDMNLLLSYYGNIFGGEILMNRSNSLHGPLSIYNWLENENYTFSPMNITLNVEPKDLSYFNILSDFYVVLNYRRFSFPAALGFSHTQRRSAGSIILGGSYIFSGTKVKSEDLRNFWGGQSHFSIKEVALGAGYAYNFSYRIFENHSLLFHFSLLPMFTVWNHYSDRAREQNALVNPELVRYNETNWIWDDVENDAVQMVLLFRNGMNYNYKNVFLGVNTVFAAQTLSKGDDLDYDVDLWIVRAFAGVRF